MEHKDKLQLLHCKLEPSHMILGIWCFDPHGNLHCIYIFLVMRYTRRLQAYSITQKISPFHELVCVCALWPRLGFGLLYTVLIIQRLNVFEWHPGRTYLGLCSRAPCRENLSMDRRCLWCVARCRRSLRIFGPWGNVSKPYTRHPK